MSFNQQVDLDENYFTTYVPILLIRTLSQLQCPSIFDLLKICEFFCFVSFFALKLTFLTAIYSQVRA